VGLALPLDTVFNIGAAAGTRWTTRTTRSRSSWKARFRNLSCKLDRPKLTPEDVKKLEAASLPEQPAR
jgi:hypothetical protein